MKGKVGAAIVGLSVIDPTRVLLGLRKKREGFGLWVLPGGGVELEEDPDAAVRRETLEEVGVELKSPTPVYHAWLPECGPDGCLMLYYMEHIDPNVPRIVAEHEFSELRWFNVFNLPKNMWPTDRRAVQRTVNLMRL